MSICIARLHNIFNALTLRMSGEQIRYWAMRSFQADIMPNDYVHYFCNNFVKSIFI